MEENFNFGFSDAEEFAGEGASVLFADSAEIKEIAPKPEGVEEPSKNSDFKTEVPGSPNSVLFSDEEGEEKSTEDVPKEKENDAEEAIDDAPEVNQFETLSDDLYELGIFTEIEGEEKPKTAEEFLEKWENEKKAGIQSELGKYLGRYGQKHIDAFNAIFVNGADPEVFYQKTAVIESVRELDLDDESNQERIVRAYYRKQGIAEDKIEKKISKLKDYDDLKDEAETSQELLAKHEEAELQRIQADTQAKHQAKEKQEQFFQQSLQKILADKIKAKDFDGLPVNDKIAAKAYDTLVTKKYVIPATGEQITDADVFLMDLKKPENYETLLKIILLKDSGFDFSKVKTKAVTEATNELFKSVHNKEKVAKRAAPTKDDNFTLNF